MSTKHDLEVGDKVVFTSKYSKHSVVFTLDSDKSGRVGMRKATPQEIAAGYRINEMEK